MSNGVASSSAHEGEPRHRFALVIGNSSYLPGLQLRNPAKDAAVIAARLKEIGFDVDLQTDLVAERFVRIVGQFCEKVKQAQGGPRPPVAVLYFAGHGVQVKGDNYLLPVDGDVRNELELNQRTVKLEYLLGPLGDAANISIVLLDCCRNNPLRVLDSDGKMSRALVAGKGMAAPRISNAKGLYLGFATAPDSVAEDGKGENSPFAAALSKHIISRDTSIFTVMINVRKQVMSETNGAQIPWDQHSLTEDFGFNTRDGWTPGAPPQPEEVERDFWLSVKDSESPQMLLSFLRQYPYSIYRNEAGQLLDKLKLLNWRRKLLSRAGAVLASLVTLFFVYVAVCWIMFDTVAGEPKVDIYGGDSTLPVYTSRDSETFADRSLAHCRFSCILSVLQPRCIAFNYVVWPGYRRCFLKFQTAYYYSQPNSHSEFFPGFWRQHQRPVPSPYNTAFDKRLQGVAASPEVVETDPKDAFRKTNRRYFHDGRGLDIPSKPYWKVTGITCQKKCMSLGDACVAFSYTAIGGRCELFASLDPHEPTIKYADKSGYVEFRGTYSGCKQPLKCDDERQDTSAPPAPLPTLETAPQ